MGNELGEGGLGEVGPLRVGSWGKEAGEEGLESEVRRMGLQE